RGHEGWVNQQKGGGFPEPVQQVQAIQKSGALPRKIAVLQAVIINARRRKGISHEEQLLAAVSLHQKPAVVQRLPWKIEEVQLELMPAHPHAIRLGLPRRNRILSETR